MVSFIDGSSLGGAGLTPRLEAGYRRKADPSMSARIDGSPDLATGGLRVEVHRPGAGLGDDVGDRGHPRVRSGTTVRSECIGSLAGLARQLGRLEAVHQPITCQPTTVEDVTALLR
jgi:hypothetical protein